MPKMPKSSEPDRQTRILDAAESAIAESGFAGASLRDIVQEARVNLATVYYYFGSKVGLMEAVLKRRFGPLRQEHLAMLGKFEAAARGRPLPVEQILEAMLLPPLRLAAKAPAKRQTVTRLIGRIVTEPKPLCPVCRFPTQIRHEKDGTSYCLCPLCSASNRRTLE